MSDVSPAQFSALPFDYIIVGGGTAGLTVAARLSENEDVTVGVIEAGKHVTDMPEINIPGFFGRALGNPDVDWMFASIPQKNLNQRRIYQPRGKVLGGSSAINFMNLSRATAAEYNAFGALGNPGWDWPSLLPYFTKSETLTLPPASIAEKYALRPQLDDSTSKFHGAHGPLSKIYPVWYPDLHATFLETMETLGVKTNPDPQNGRNVGVFTFSNSVDPITVTRCYSANAYFEPNKTRKNLYVLTDAFTTKILSQSSSHANDGLVTATGVQFQSGAQQYHAFAKREVILAAGAFQTPQLLELSGIGNPSILRSFGIETVVDLPSVGENLQDHPCLPVVQEVTNDTQTFDVLQDPEILREQAALYANEKKGMFTSVHCGVALLPLSRFMDDTALSNITNLSHAESSSRFHGNSGIEKQLALQQEWFDTSEQAQIEIINCPARVSIEAPSNSVQQLGENTQMRYHSFVGLLLHPRSRGSVHLDSSDPNVPPAIDPKYLDDPVDLEIMTQYVKYAQKVMKHGPMAKHHAGFANPGPEVQSDEEIKEWIRNHLGSTWHPMGTASMLPKQDGGVVDHDLLVYGTKNLRVVDASVLPIQLSCHLQMTIYAVAEKAADIIKRRYESLLGQSWMGAATLPLLLL